MKSFIRNALVASLSLALIPSLALASDSDDDEKEYSVNMGPLNDSGVYAEVELELENGNQLKVSIKASGLEAGKPHPQHIHGFGSAPKNSTCPGAEADADGDGVISVGEGGPSYGPIMLPLNPFNLVDAAVA